MGVTHDNELRKKYHLTLDVIKKLIVEFNPDVICGEVLPCSWEQYNKDRTLCGYLGEPASEYGDLIFPLCEAKNYEFVPIDWLELDVWMDFDPLHLYNDQKKQQLNVELERWSHMQLSTWDAGIVPLNSVEYDNVTRQKYEWLERINPQAHLFRWVCRHLIMIQRIKNAIKKHLGKRILIIAGADHNYMFYEGLLAEPNIQLVYPLKS
nr:hypothetical protein [Paenibacillus sp. GSMTC-2017]